MAVWSEASFREVNDSTRIDADYYEPKYLEVRDKLSWGTPLKEYARSLIHPAEFTRRYSNEGWRVIRTQNVRPLCMNYSSNEVFLDSSIASRIDQNHLIDEDILVTRTGANFGQCSLFYSNSAPSIATSHTFILKTNCEIDPAYLALFLNTKHGRLLIDRGMYGSSQPEIAPKFLLRIPVPRFSAKVEADLSANVRRAYTLRYESSAIYTQAQQLLESELGLDKLRFDKPVGYTARFSELELSHRADAQHYQPRFTRLLEHLAKFPIKRIREIRRYNRRGIQPVYVDGGSHAVVNSQHLGPKHINYDGLQKTTKHLFNLSPEAHIQPDDLLIYTTGAYIGRTNVYLDESPAFASNHVDILRLLLDIDHAYMSMVFQSIIGQYQTQKHARGSAQAELYPADIDKFVVPLLSLGKQQEIGNLVRESLIKQRESAHLLDQAKSRVEQLIEEAVRV